MRRLAALTIVLALAACTKPADRIAAKLESRGMPAKHARCMGARLADRLDDAQLERLNELAKFDRDHAGKLTIDQFLDQLNRDGDPRLVAAVVKAGLHCVL